MRNIAANSLLRTDVRRSVGPPVAASFAALAACVSAAHAQCRYTATFVSDYQCPGSWSASSFVGTQINANGTWCGYRRHCPPNDSVDVPVVCGLGETPTELPLPRGVDNAQAQGINDDGVVVGLIWPLQTYAAMWIGDRIVIIPPGPGGLYSVANAVNTSLQVVGTRGLGKTHVDSHVAFVWQDGVMTDIDPGRLLFSFGYDISNSGIAVGMMGSLLIDARAFRWTNGETELLEPIAGGVTSVAYSVNDAGMAVGESIIDHPRWGLVARPTYWVTSEGLELPEEPGYRVCWARAINNHSIIVGSEFAPTDPETMQPAVGLLWVDGVRMRLQELVDAPGPFYCFEGLDINDAGQILARCSSADGFGLCVLTPVDRPAADLTGDCTVDTADLGVLLSDWGATRSIADLNSDSLVDGKDLAVLLGAWTSR